MKLKESTSIVFLFFAGFFIFGFPHLIRYLNFGAIFPGSLPYYHASSTHFYTIFINLFPNHTGHFIVPFVCGMLSLFIFYSILKAFNFNIKLRFIASIFLIISPAMIYASVISTPFSLFLPLILFAFRLIISEKKIINMLGIFLFVACSFFGFVEGLLVAITLFFYAALSGRLIKSSIIAGILALAVSTYFFITPTIQKVPSIIVSLLSDFGGLNGFSIFAMVLALIGIGLSWSVKKRFVFIYFAFLLLLLLSIFFNSQVNVLLNVLVVFFSAFSFLRLTNRKWHIHVLKFWTVLIIVLGLLFSGISYVERVSNLPPSVELVDTLEWISTSTNEESIIFADQGMGFWIGYYADRTAFSDDFNKQEKITANLLSGRNLQNTKLLLSKNEIDYILIDKTNLPRNLYFLFTDNSTFRLVHESENYEVWYVIG